MDNPFEITQYQPTRPPGPGDRQQTPEEITALFSQLCTRTKNIIKHPYDPDNWVRRAKMLSELRYPELAGGDAHKAVLLCRSYIRVLDERKHSEWRLGHRMGFWMKDPFPRHEPQDEFDEEEYDDRLEQYLGKLQCRANDVEKSNLYYVPIYDEGRIRRRMYPWMLDRHRRRSGGLVDQLNDEFVENAASIEEGRPFCVAKSNAFGHQDGGNDVLGVFAAQQIDKHEIILIDKTNVWGCNFPRPRGEYETLRRKQPNRNDGQVLREVEGVKVDLGWIREEVGKFAGPVLLNCRLLLSGINDDVRHPLDHHLIARLTPTYHEDMVERFVLLNDIAIPNKALQSFGIDIFADHNYDTWILLTIQARILNNSCGDPMAESLNPLFALFNHSCEPNVEWSSTANNHQTILVRARRNIRKGEQLLVEYDQFMRDQPLEVRRKRMYRWLDGPCQCLRCVAEEAEKRSEVRIKSDWDDIPDKAVFPEDLLTAN